MDLASKDSYIQRLASKVISQPDQERKKKQFAYPQGKRYNGPLNNNKKKGNRKSFKEKDTRGKTPGFPKKSLSSIQPTQKGAANKNGQKAQTQSINGSSTQALEGGNESKFSTVDILRKRLHEKIEESRGQGAPKDALSEAVQAKRAKRKLERERKKRKRKEFRMKELAQQNVEEQQPELKPKAVCESAASKRNVQAIIFNKVEMVEEGYVDKVQKKKNKKQSMKGNITPLTGKNYKQLLSRVEARNAKLEGLREKDEAKARDLEEKIKWTNLLYKAEGIKIKDDEEMLRTALKKKEQKRAQRKKKWAELSGNLAEKMQQRQDKRTRNIQKRKQLKTEKKKNKARKKGRVLPEDLKKAAV
ncbi:surfeit locus protein 6 homolog [Takifugu rubripes]|uniref:surfeit locus protein 6 homolog n=1 Tax=Takifugu rubripes TaxID=31033 RepID=UPI0000363736|nr:surfeit locus protein 6 homolog [Takifugu rubripes]XP_056873941.1 surfeit locus protein 6 [Takifugu flavidus]|eukprot:XP_011602952.1 PREDICTED: surfeit locus protein 6 [Takifugu rubripes]